MSRFLPWTPPFSTALLANNLVTRAAIKEAANHSGEYFDRALNNQDSYCPAPGSAPYWQHLQRCGLQSGCGHREETGRAAAPEAMKIGPRPAQGPLGPGRLALGVGPEPVAPAQGNPPLKHAPVERVLIGKFIDIFV